MEQSIEETDPYFYRVSYRGTFASHTLVTQIMLTLHWADKQGLHLNDLKLIFGMTAKDLTPYLTKLETLGIIHRIRESDGKFHYNRFHLRHFAADIIEGDFENQIFFDKFKKAQEERKSEFLKKQPAGASIVGGGLGGGDKGGVKKIF